MEGRPLPGFSRKRANLVSGETNQIAQLATSLILPQVNQWLSILEEEEDSEDEEA